MINNRKQESRRPLVLPPESRDILNSIRDSLQTSTKGTHIQGNGNVRDSADYVPTRHDSVSSSGTPSLLKPSASSQTKKKNNYNTKALDEIRDSLKPYKTTDSGSSSLESAQDSSLDKERTSQSSKPNKNLDQDSVYSIQQQLESKNGISKTGLTIRPSRKNSIEGSDSASTRSESPGMSTLTGNPRQLQGQQMSQNLGQATPAMSRVLSPTMPMLVNGDQTPPPVPPRLPFSILTSVLQSQSTGGSDGSCVSTTAMSTQSQPTQNQPSNQMRRMPIVSPGLPPYYVENQAVKNVSSVIIKSSTPNMQRVTSSPVIQQTGVSPPVQITRNGPNGPAVTIEYRQPPPPYQGYQWKPATVTIKSEQPGIYQQSLRTLPSHPLLVGPDGIEHHNIEAVRINVSQASLGQPVSAWSASGQSIVTGRATSREVAKPVLQTATAPDSPINVQSPQGPKYISSVETHVNGSQNPHHLPKGKFQIQITEGHQGNGRYRMNPEHPAGMQRPLSKPCIQIQIGNKINSANILEPHMYAPQNDTPVSTPRSGSPQSTSRNTQSPLSISSMTSNPSTSSDIPDKPPPPYPGPSRPLHITNLIPGNHAVPIVQPIPQNPNPMRYQIAHSTPAAIQQGIATAPTVQSRHEQPPLPPRVPIYQVQGKPPPPTSIETIEESQPPIPPKGFRKPEMTECGSEANDVDTDNDTTSTTSDTSTTENKRTCTSPIPERKPDSEEKDILRRDTLVRNYSPQAYKFFMEQHIENLLKNVKQRQTRRMQLEKEMEFAHLSEDAQHQMRRMLQQKESNYIRMKRSKMKRDMFEKIKTLGVGAFGEVHLVRKRDVPKLYAMKTLRKIDVYKRNQVAHVKAERDILAEADNEWVVKLYYSFQDRDNLYFVMDYVPGGDLMGLLIKFGIFEEPLAKFYIAELVLAIDSVHKMGFIHRDIKPDNILIDKDGHIKLTDFGLCTGFRWTHNSKYYQESGIHPRQDSMDVNCSDTPSSADCKCPKSKTLERRNRHRKCLAHSLVGTPNYIAPEVLLRQGYTSCCDWWSVGVILYEMLVGQPPFYAQTPQETQNKVIHWDKTLRIPPEANLSQPSKDLIIQLCRGAENRLGRNGANEIKSHQFFASIQFEGLRKQPALHKPKIKHAMDTSNFDPVEEREQSSDLDSEFRNLDHPHNGKYPEHAFFEFTFKRFFDDAGHPYPTVRHTTEMAPKDANETESENGEPVYV